MLKENKKTLIITDILTILPIFIGLYFWDRLPDVMATHFGFNNQPDGFSNKIFAVVGMPLIMLAIQWVGVLITTHDPRKQNISPKMFAFVLWIVPAVSLLMAAVLYPYNLGYKVDMMFAAGLFLGMMFIIIGNYIPKARQNYTIGIRVPWTLANEENWNRTHRLAGWLWVICGILMIALTFLGAVQPVFLFAPVVLATCVPVVYSFWLHIKGM